MSLAERKAALIRRAARTIAIPDDDGATGCTIWLKLEYLLSSGSTRHRVAAFILEDIQIDEREAIAASRGPATSGLA